MKKRRRRKGMERVYAEGKGKGENEMWKKRGKEGEGEERRGRERRMKNREGGTRSVPPPLDTFHSAKLGNNMTHIKGKLGKNTTPTS